MKLSCSMFFYCVMLCPCCCCSYKAVENTVEMMSSCCSSVHVMLLCGFAPGTVVVVLWHKKSK
jgi:hypothetical protein